MALTSLLPLRSMWYYEYLSCWPFLSAGSYRVCMIQLPFDYTDLFFIPNPECVVCWVTYYWPFYILMSSAIAVLCMTVCPVVIFYKTLYIAHKPVSDNDFCLK